MGLRHWRLCFWIPVKFIRINYYGESMDQDLETAGEGKSALFLLVPSSLSSAAPLESVTH